MELKVYGYYGKPDGYAQPAASMTSKTHMIGAIIYRGRSDVVYSFIHILVFFFLLYSFIRVAAVPIVTGLCRGAGHVGKIALAKALLRAVADRLGPLCLLLAAWYMRGSVIRAAMRRGHTVVGQVRRDTALFELPPPRMPGRRGRPRP